MATSGITIHLHIHPEAAVVQLYPDQSYWELKEECLQKGCLFEDPSFKASLESLGYDKDIAGTSKYPKLTWKRPKDLCKNEMPHFINKGMTLQDVMQQNLGDCWFMAAAACLTLNKELLCRVVPPDQSFAEGDYAGIFHFQFWHFCQWVDVVVDDRLPVLDGKLYFAGWNESDEGNDFWMPLLEKAYAKLYGSYSAIIGGQLNEAFVDFTGGIGEKIRPIYHQPNLFETIEMALANKFLMGAGTKNHEYKSTGIVRNHAYSIINSKKLNINGKEERLLRLRNPWGFKEWQHRWSDNSEIWSNLDPVLRRELNVQKNEGEFWMELDDFKRNFGHLDICHLSVNTSKKEGVQKSWETISVHGCWMKDINAGGYMTPENNNFWNNPRVAVSLQHPDDTQLDPKGLQQSDCTMVVSLMQKNWRRGTRLKLYFYIFRVPEEVTKEYRHLLTTTQKKELLSKLECSGRTSGWLRDITGEFQVSPGDYLIIPCTEFRGDETDFVLRIFTEAKLECLGQGDEISTDAKSLHVGALPRTGVNQMIDNIFKQYAGRDQKIRNVEFKDFLNNNLNSGRKLVTDGFPIEDCQKIIQHFDETGTGRLTLNAFKQAWARITEWGEIFMHYDADSSGIMDAYKMQSALEDAGFNVNHRSIQALVEKHGNSSHQICFHKFVFILVLLENVFRMFKSWDAKGSGKIDMFEKEWMELITSF